MRIYPSQLLLPYHALKLPFTYLLGANAPEGQQLALADRSLCA